MVTQHTAVPYGPGLLRQCLTTHRSPVPSSIRAALLDPHWRRVMEEEYAALLANQTWDLVLRPSGANVVTDRWIWTQAAGGWHP